jgi:glyoxylase-like metal-dependent hydrolase (beta-lactamase superfamily II)
VSAYVLVRGGEAALVDTGFGSSMDRIGAVLDAAGPGWGGVRHMVITHAHGDHFDSLAVPGREAARRAFEAINVPSRHTNAQAWRCPSARTSGS